MTNLTSETASDAPISASVKWYDPAKGCGFLKPHDGSPDIYCHAPVLAAVGLDVLLAGATVDCETMQGHRGPEVSRIRAVDFSTAADPAPSAGSRAQRPAPAQQDAASGSGRQIKALVKWFMPTKGYGFLEPEDNSADVFCHVTAVQAAGHETLPPGAVVTCEISPGERGPQVSRVINVEIPAGVAAGARRRDERPDPARAGMARRRGR